MSANGFRLKFSKSADGYPALLVGFAWAAKPLLYYVGIFADKIGIGSGLLITLLFIILGIKSIDYIKKTISISDFFVLVLFVGIFLSSYLLFPDNKEYLDKYKDLFFLAVPYYIIGRVYSDRDMRECLNWFSYICIAAMAVYILFWGKQTGSLEDVDDSMVSSYMILPHVLMTLITAFKKHSVSSILFSLLGVFLILSFGTRGPLICVFIFVAVLLIIMSPFKHKAIGYSITIGAITIILAMFDTILMSLRDLIASIGLSTRIMDYYTMGMIADSSGRDDIQELLIDTLQKDYFTGYGIAGDWCIAGVYSHNIILEFLVSFGVIFGGALLILMLIGYFKGLLCCKTNGQKETWLVFVVCGFVRLLFSGTFVTEAFFYLVIGYCITLIKDKRKLLINYQV